MEIIFFRKTLIKVKIEAKVLLHCFNRTLLLAVFFEFLPTHRRTAASLFHLLKLLSSLIRRFLPHILNQILSLFSTKAFLLFYHGDLEIPLPFMQVFILLANVMSLQESVHHIV